MKVAIVTWFHYKNYGTALQCVALNNKIKQLGYDCDILNYIPVLKNNKKFLDRISNGIRWRIEKLLLKLYKNDISIRNKKFDKFINENITFSDYIKNNNILEDQNKKYDTFVCGSDQIWAPNNLDGIYYLNFVNQNKNKIAYAPSIGLNSIPDDSIEKVKKWVIRFNHLSVRERQGAEIIEKLTGKKCKCVLDPTLLETAEQWRKIAKKIKKRKPYLLCYFLTENDYYWKYVKQIAKKRNLDIVLVPIECKSYFRLGVKKETKCGPKEFISLIDNADFICTDSFHGTIFSINLNKDFYCFKRFKDNDKICQNSRIYNILNIVKLEDRLISSKSKIDLNNLKIKDYNSINKILDSERKKSLTFLENSLNHNS